MADITIKTNNIPRPIVYGIELTEKQKKDFDYLDDIESASFFIYKNQVYDLGEFMRVNNNPALNGWEGYQSDSFFSGVLVRYTRDNDFVIVGTYYS